MKRFNVINYNINRESIIDLPDIHHSLIIIPETLYENSDIISTNSDNKSTIVVPTFKIEEEEEEGEEEEEEEEETVQSNDDQFVESNDKSREVNDEKSKNFSDIDLCETKQKNSFSAVRPSLTIDTSSLPVSHVNNEISSKRKHDFDCLFYLKSNKIRLIILSLIIIIAVVIIVVVLVKK
ncbi:uncharacterized protein OCT59_027848 [Rhizophagus irregularis]|uniref:Uncharacterized protein n=1 Tax=Rhizophagus irregularis (strain DAOM 181602 / DAOM 197198 / MUCL 43194) TaxID=747089 RepID=A0A2P4QW92_RHIID|nr:hypothetical protein GLOIN_2v1503275 [Rhizophagus irregularis DAOM 181602=DAOM 197198]POG81887.1 hypothetical protein GLOIN_2v1503275 [Rhizophagus irregularis DAOM 181602=DAOM 197198]UZO07565.1 hypothetical protein OCT59_027848 [Rhizophagus irregularis]GBC15576.2 hypothetical protein GLOIN_2v1503275 [Rhizophagus irregularis DAOM 181602=DAOM 197198]|eukprot:XP_025188753.1 hypothetical protein GLOIN_2v1503275 [Rhizophagus irregularis DAOM 181602=DAOM 197198]